MSIEDFFCSHQERFSGKTFEEIRYRIIPDFDVGCAHDSTFSKLEIIPFIGVSKEYNDGCFPI